MSEVRVQKKISVGPLHVARLTNNRGEVETKIMHKHIIVAEINSVEEAITAGKTSRLFAASPELLVLLKECANVITSEVLTADSKAAEHYKSLMARINLIVKEID